MGGSLAGWLSPEEAWPATAPAPSAAAPRPAAAASSATGGPHTTNSMRTAVASRRSDGARILNPLFQHGRRTIEALAIRTQHPCRDGAELIGLVPLARLDRLAHTRQ